MNTIKVGARIERLRRRKGLSQSRFAQELNISPSYLNLIEHNRRPITAQLLLQIAHKLGVNAEELAESDESRLVGDLTEIFSSDALSDTEITRNDLKEIATSHPKFAHALIYLFGKYDQIHSKLKLIDPTEEPDLAADAVSDFIQTNSNYFATLEHAAERIRKDIDMASEIFEYGLRAYLLNAFGVRWSATPLADGSAFQMNADTGELNTSDGIPAESSAFAAAEQLGALGAAAEIEDIVERSALPEEAFELAREALMAYFAAALIMPYDEFFRACMDFRYDVERIARRFRASFEQVCHRMTSLQRPGSAGVPLHLVRTDIAGNISKRFSMSGIHIPRHSGACPRWNVYTSFLQPDQISVQVSETPEGRRFFCIAKALTKSNYKHNSPKRYHSIGLGCDISYASSLVYSDGIDLANPLRIVPIGFGCRICPRPSCDQRAHRPLAGAMLMSNDGQ